MNTDNLFLYESKAKEDNNILSSSTSSKESDNKINPPLDFWEAYEYYRDNSNFFIGAKIKAKEMDPISIDQFPTVFLEFAELNISYKPELLNFIEKYGFLTDNLIQNNLSIKKKISLNDNSRWKDTDKSDDGIIYGEPLSVWVLFQIEIRKLISYWQDIRKFYSGKDFSSLVEIVSKTPLIIENEFEKNHYFIHYFSKRNYFINYSQIKSDLPTGLFEKINIDEYLKKYEGKEIFNSWAREYRITNDEKINFMHDFLKFQLNNFQQKINHQIIMVGSFLGPLLTKRKLQTPGNHILYNSLMGGIVSQLAKSIASNTKYQRCLECQKWMVESSQGRIGKKYCNPNCRASAHRRRDGIKYLYEATGADGVLSLKKQLNAFVKAYNGTDEDIQKFDKKFQNQLKGKPKFEALLINVTDNIINNISVWTTPYTISNHLDIPHEYISKIDMDNAVDLASHQARIITPYRYWDYF